MIRFIDLGKQIGPYSKEEDDASYNDWPRQFAFFNTCTDNFFEIEGEQVFDSWKDFETIMVEIHAHSQLARFKVLCPDWVFTKK